MKQPDLELQADRRARLLAAAVLCFGRRGIHQTSMQEIAGEAGMSAGNVYRYFPSKEAIIDAIAECERQDAAALLSRLEGSDDFLSALRAVINDYVQDDGRNQIALGLEIIAEAVRNPRVAALYARLDAEATTALTRVVQKAAARGQVDPGLDPNAVASLLVALVDAVLWRRGADPTFDAATVVPTLEVLLTRFLSPPASRETPKA
jgi:AcrR family transcriptional regulator